MKKSTERRMNLVVDVILVVQVAGVVSILIFNAVHEHRYHRDLLGTDALTLKFEGPEDIELQDPHAYVRDDGLVISGFLHRSEVGGGPVASRIDVKLQSASGTVLQETTLRDLPRCERGGVHFSTRIPEIPSGRSVLSIRAFADQEDASGPKPSSLDPGG